MPKALFTPIGRGDLKIENVFPLAKLISRHDSEDEFEIGDVRLTCRFWPEGGDFVSKKILGCSCAIESGRLNCENKDATLQTIYDTQCVIGIVGPDITVNRIASKLASTFSGVLVDGDEAVLVSRNPSIPG